jgi:hypothetical protein
MNLSIVHFFVTHQYCKVIYIVTREECQ